MGILWFIFCTTLLAKLSRCGCYILIAVTSKDTGENSKFHQSFSTYLRYTKLFLFCKNINGGVDTIKLVIFITSISVGSAYIVHVRVRITSQQHGRKPMLSLSTKNGTNKFGIIIDLFPYYLLVANFLKKSFDPIF